MNFIFRRNQLDCQLPLGLSVESLETRQMLSTVQIFVAGQTGEEIFDLEIDGAVVETYSNVGGDASARQFEGLVFQTETPPETIRIVFKNDFAEGEFDRNLVVDAIQVDGVRYETEDPAVLSTGTWRVSDGCAPGFKQSEWLTCDGYLEYKIDQTQVGIVGDFGLVVANSSWQTVEFQDVLDPVIILGTPSFKGPSPGVAQLSNVANDRFDVRFKEWRYLDGGHGVETIDYLALENGRFVADDGSVWETGKFTQDGNGRFKSISFKGAFDSTPAVFLTIQTQSGAPVVVRADNVTRFGFDSAIFEEQAERGTRHGNEIIGYLAIESASSSGVVTVGGQTLPYLIDSGLANENPTQIAGVEVFVQEEASADAELRHAFELINAMSLGSGFFAMDVDYRGGDTASLRSIEPRFRFELPDGFELESIETGTAAFPFVVGVEVIGPERVLVAEETGQIWLVDQGTRGREPILNLRDQLSNLNTGIGSVSGFAADPDFDANGFIYVTYTTTVNNQSFGRLERFELDPESPEPVLAESGFALIGNDATDGLVADRFHNLGDIEFGSDGTLLFSWGDTASNDTLDPRQLRSQDLNVAAGKLFRIDPTTGQGLSSNPFFTGDGSDVASKVWALGLRNGYRFDIDVKNGSLNPAAGNPGVVYIADVGRENREEINVVTGGENLGWPYYEGSLSYHPNDPGIAHTLPAIELDHPDARSVIGGAIYSGSTWPEIYRGSFFVADFVEGWIRSYSDDGNGGLVETEFAAGIRGVTDMEFDSSTGDIYLVGRGRNTIFGIADGLDGLYRLKFTG